MLYRCKKNRVLCFPLIYGNFFGGMCEIEPTYQCCQMFSGAFGTAHFPWLTWKMCQRCTADFSGQQFFAWKPTDSWRLRAHVAPVHICIWSFT